MNIFTFGFQSDSMTDAIIRGWLLVYPLMYGVPAVLIVCALISFAYNKGKASRGKVSRKQLYLVPAILVGVAVVLYAVMRFLY